MRPARIITTVIFAAAIAVTGWSVHSRAAQPSPPHPTHTPAPVDRQALIYTVVLRQLLTSGDGYDGWDAGFGGRRFPRIFVIDHAVADAGGSGHALSEDGPIPPTARRAITRALTDVGPLTFVASHEEIILEPRGCTHVRDHGILITLGPVEGTGGRVQVVVYGFVSCLGTDSRSLTYQVQQTSSGWRVSGITPPPVMP